MLNNTITSQVVNNNVVVVTSENQINVTQPITNVIEVATPGPQGPAGIVDTGSLLITASATLNVITFEKGDGSTFNITVDTGSINTSSFATTGSNIFIGNQIITGSVDITGSLNASNITGSLYGTASYANTASYVQNVLSSSYASTASYVENAQTSSNILGGKATHVPYFITDTSLATSSIYQSGSTSVIINQDNNTTANPEALYVWQPHPTSINVVSGKGNLDNYLQLNIQNTNQGTNASSDIVATANNGSEIDNYIDMGINSENFTGFLGGPNDAYLYTHGHNFWIGNINDTPYNIFFFNSSSLNPLITLTPDQRVLLNVDTEVTGKLTATNGITGSLLGTASYADKALTASYAENVPLTASYALEALHASNADTATYASTAGNGGVTQIIAGSGIILIPAGGTGAVTVASTGVGGVTIISGSNVTQSFNNVSTWTFNHNLGIRTPIIEVFDSNYNQIIPLNVQLTDTASATITFPTAESGFAIASIGGSSATALSASYALQATYADTASFYTETDPIFVAKSASLATTGSNRFIGNQTITGSLTVSGSNTLTNIGPAVFSGSVTLVNGATGSLLGTASLAQTASYVLNAISSSYSATASLAPNYVLTSVTSSMLSPYVLNSQTSSFATTGSNIFRGNQIVTGSLFTSGSNTLIGTTNLSGSINISGSSTIIGNTTLSGSLEVSGSTILHNSVFIVTGSTYIKGETHISGSTNITGSFNVLNGDINVISGSSFTRWGNKLFNYGQFSDTTIQSGSADTAYAMKFNTTDFALGVSIQNNVNNLPTRIQVQNTGIYNLQFSAQVANTANTTITYDVWFAYTGSNIANSNTQGTITKVPGATGRVVAAWNIAMPIQANDYVEIFWSCDASTLQIQSQGPQTGPTRPAIPSVIATLTQIA